MSSTRPIVVAYDGSDPAQAAVESAASLFPGRLLIVVSVWEPDLAIKMAPIEDAGGLGGGLGYMTPTPEEVATLDRAQRDRATDLADAGCRLAVEHGASATEPVAVADASHVAETLAAIADQHDAEALVIGSRGLGGFKAGLLGSTSRDLLHKTRRPVLVVRAPN
jgi:nucleotide-binding universal stress UspA family protein